jgi:hypothetical protein
LVKEQVNNLNEEAGKKMWAEMYSKKFKKRPEQVFYSGPFAEIIHAPGEIIRFGSSALVASHSSKK